MAGLKLSELLAGKRTKVCAFGPYEIRVTYRLSERTLNRNGAALADDNVGASIARLVEEWDLTDDDGVPIPLDEQGLAEVPIPALRAIFWQVMGDTGLGEAASSSDAG